MVHILVELQRNLRFWIGLTRSLKIEMEEGPKLNVNCWFAPGWFHFNDRLTWLHPIPNCLVDNLQFVWRIDLSFIENQCYQLLLLWEIWKIKLPLFFVCHFSQPAIIISKFLKVILYSGLLNLVNFNFENILGGGQPIKSLAHGIAHFTRCS